MTPPSLHQDKAAAPGTARGGPALEPGPAADLRSPQASAQSAAATWFVRRQEGLTADEQAEFGVWLAADPAHPPALEKLGRLWDGLDELPADRIAALREPLSAARPASEGNRAETPSLRSPVPPGRRSRPGGASRLLPQAAMAALVLAISGGGWLAWESWQGRASYAQSFSTVRGQLQEVQLPDGSRLLLDTATRAEVRLYRQRREVRLSEGRALFTVQGDPGRPFEVLAGPLRVTAIGTRFSVRHTASPQLVSGSDVKGGASVEVDEGRVRVQALPEGGASSDRAAGGAGGAGTRGIELSAGQAIAADAGGRLAPVTRQPAGASPPWREGRVNFDDTPLSQALAEFERYGDTRLVVSDPAVAALRLNGSFDLRQFPLFLRALPQVLPVRLRQRADGLTEVERAG